jgi:hypothetical protein
VAHDIVHDADSIRATHEPVRPRRDGGCEQILVTERLQNGRPVVE